MCTGSDQESSEEEVTFDVSAIVEHRHGQSNRMEFKVHWDGYEEQWDTWEPRSVLNNNVVFKEYLKTNQMK